MTIAELFSAGSTDWLRVNSRLRTYWHTLIAVTTVPLLTVAAIAIAIFEDVPVVRFIGVVSIMVIMIFAIWAWVLVTRRVRSIGYRLESRELKVSSGIMFRRVVSVPFARMQLVEVSAGPLARAFSLASAQLHTASASTATATTSATATTATTAAAATTPNTAVRMRAHSHHRRRSVRRLRSGRRQDHHYSRRRDHRVRAHARTRGSGQRPAHTASSHTPPAHVCGIHSGRRPSQQHTAPSTCAGRSPTPPVRCPSSAGSTRRATASEDRDVIETLTHCREPFPFV